MNRKNKYVIISLDWNSNKQNSYYRSYTYTYLYLSLLNTYIEHSIDWTVLYFIDTHDCYVNVKRDF